MNRNLFILGDSYSTYEGYIPKDYLFYYSDNNSSVHSVEDTWWHIFAKENDFNIIQNDSFSGSTVCNTVRPTLSVATSFINRLDSYAADNFSQKNNINTMFIFGGTNDSWINAPVGNLLFSDWTSDDLLCALPAFCYLLHRAKQVVEHITVIINSDLKQEITDGFIKACEENQIPYVCLKDIDKENGHPTALGMKQIAKQVASHLYQN